MTRAQKKYLIMSLVTVPIGVIFCVVAGVIAGAVIPAAQFLREWRERYHVAGIEVIPKGQEKARLN